MSSVQSTQTGKQSPRPAAPPTAGPLAPRPGTGGAGVPPELASFFTSLLDAQCRLVGAIAGLVYLLPSDSRRGGVAAFHVVRSDATGDASEVLTDALIARLERIGAEAAGPKASGENGTAARAAGAGMVETVTLPRGGLYQAEPTHRVLACPLTAEGRPEGATVLVLPAARRVDFDEALEKLSLTSARFEAFLWRQQCMAEAQQKAKLRETLELLDAAQQGADAEAMGSLMCHELQRRFGCTRVSIGMIRRGRLRLAALSGADEIDRKGAAVEAIEAAMDECADQDIEIVCPPPAESERDPAQRRVTRAHDELGRKFGPSAMLSLPLRVEGDLVGVVLLERDAASPFPVGAVPLLRLVAEFIGPALWTRRLADRGFWAVSRDRFLDMGVAAVGPRHMGVKLVAALALAAIVGLSIPVVPGRISATTEMKATVSRTVPPPFSGYLARVNFKPGDTVKIDDVLAQMDTSELDLRKSELEAQRNAQETERDEAQAKGEMGKAKSFDAQIKATTIQIAQTNYKLSFADVKSPLDGQISRGDLEAFVGAHVEPTQSLFEIVQPKTVAVLQVDERDIGRVKLGQRGWVVAKSIPGQKIPITVTRINPAAEAIQGANVYQVEAEVTDAAIRLHPGTTGTARLEDGTTSGLHIILRPLIDEARMRLWW
jgi:multidrug resistance efflux pump